MDSQQFMELNRRRALRVDPVIDIHDFKDKSDRTLTISKTVMKSSTHSTPWIAHFFILDGRLHFHNYEVPKNKEPITRFLWSGNSLDARMIGSKPSPKLRDPIGTDFEFAEMMENLHMPLHFFDTESSESRVEKIDGIFYGLINRTSHKAREGGSYSDGFRTFTKPA